MNELSKWVDTHQTAILAAVTIALALLAVICGVLASKLGKLHDALRGFLAGKSGADLEDVIRQTLEEARAIREQLRQSNESLRLLEENQKRCLQRVGLVRYDAFKDVSGHQSFSLALLDAHNNGAVVTALLGRTESRFYGKSIANGKPLHTLSEEEDQALRMAMDGSGPATGQL